MSGAEPRAGSCSLGTGCAGGTWDPGEPRQTIRRLLLLLLLLLTKCGYRGMGETSRQRRWMPHETLIVFHQL
eukprot:14027540-Heterocapsa_arctica.AAC.1